MSSGEVHGQSVQMQQLSVGISRSLISCLQRWVRDLEVQLASEVHKVLTDALEQTTKRTPPVYSSEEGGPDSSVSELLSGLSDALVLPVEAPPIPKPPPVGTADSGTLRLSEVTPLTAIQNSSAASSDVMPVRPKSAGEAAAEFDDEESLKFQSEKSQHSSGINRQSCPAHIIGRPRENRPTVGRQLSLLVPEPIVSGGSSTSTLARQDEQPEEYADLGMSSVDSWELDQPQSNRSTTSRAEPSSNRSTTSKGEENKRLSVVSWASKRASGGNPNEKERDGRGYFHNAVNGLGSCASLRSGFTVDHRSSAASQKSTRSRVDHSFEDDDDTKQVRYADMSLDKMEARLEQNIFAHSGLNFLPSDDAPAKSPSAAPRFTQMLGGTVRRSVVDVWGMSQARTGQLKAQGTATKDLSSPTLDINPLPSRLRIWLRVFGIMPMWEDEFYDTRDSTSSRTGSHPNGGADSSSNLSILNKIIIFFLLVTGFVFSVTIAAGVYGDVMHGLRSLSFAVLSGSTLLLFLILQGSVRSRRILHASGVLIDYARYHNSAKQLAKKGRKQWKFLAAAVSLSLLSHPALAGFSTGRLRFLDEDSGVLCTSFLFFAVVVCAYIGVTYYLLHAVNALCLMVDHFCIEFLDVPDIERSFTDWNVLQAILHYESASMQRCILMIVISVSMNAVVFAAHATELMVETDPWEVFGSIVPFLMQLLCVMFLGYEASMVSYKCIRVPPFINSLDLEVQARFYLVDYIKSSDTAFKVFDVNLDPVFMMYVIYGFCMVATYFAVAVLGLGEM